MGMEFKIKEAELVQLFIEKIRRFGTTKHGTYNAADPTNMENIKASFLMDHGDYYSTINVEIHDITWAVEITFSEDNTMGDKFAKLASGSWDPHDKEWNNFDCQEAFFELMEKVLIYGQHESEMPDMDDLYVMGYGEE